MYYGVKQGSATGPLVRVSSMNPLLVNLSGCEPGISCKSLCLDAKQASIADCRQSHHFGFVFYRITEELFRVVGPISLLL